MKQSNCSSLLPKTPERFWERAEGQRNRKQNLDILEEATQACPNSPTEVMTKQLRLSKKESASVAVNNDVPNPGPSHYNLHSRKPAIYRCLKLLQKQQVAATHVLVSGVARIGIHLTISVWTSSLFRASSSIKTARNPQAEGRIRLFSSKRRWSRLIVQRDVAHRHITESTEGCYVHTSAFKVLVPNNKSVNLVASISQHPLNVNLNSHGPATASKSKVLSQGPMSLQQQSQRLYCSHWQTLVPWRGPLLQGLSNRLYELLVVAILALNRRQISVKRQGPCCITIFSVGRSFRFKTMPALEHTSLRTASSIPILTYTPRILMESIGRYGHLSFPLSSPLQGYIFPTWDCLSRPCCTTLSLCPAKSHIGPSGCSHLRPWRCSGNLSSLSLRSSVCRHSKTLIIHIGALCPCTMHTAEEGKESFNRSFGKNLNSAPRLESVLVLVCVWPEVENAHLVWFSSSGVRVKFNIFKVNSEIEDNSVLNLECTSIKAYFFYTSDIEKGYKNEENLLQKFF
ncbi:hypothetical protein VP01_2378g3 [Puccinia sorghi]|uniref:Uncharacterized protein n=1 Tax=Puccinia sorghi TaxID=27349 RepID=A0A0L6V7Q0_9BASI|nr:hypothetical protein VP01_2378g3 [Puccinia sorghi]